MTGIGFKILTPTPIPKLPRVPPQPITEDMKGSINSKDSLGIGQLSVKSSI